MNALNRFARLALLLMFTIAGFAGVLGVSPATAQSTVTDDTVYVSEMTGLEVETDGQFIITDVIEEVGYEDIRIESDFGLLTVTAFEGDAGAEETLEAYIDGFATAMDSLEEVESDSSRGEAWSLSVADTSGIEMTVYGHVYEDYVDGFVMLFIAAVPTQVFEDVMLEAQEDITIDGEPMFADADVDELVGYLGDFSGGATEDDDVLVEDDDATVGSDDDATVETGDVATVESDDDGSSARVDAKLPDDEDPDELDDDRGRAEDDDTTAIGGGDFEDLGLISDNEYESPQFGIGIEWDDAWFVDTDDESSVVSDEESLFDTVMLVWDGPGDGLMWIDITTTEGLTPDDMVDYWTSGEYMDDFTDPDAKILLEDSDDVSGAVLYRDYLEDGEEVLILMEVAVLEDEEHMSIVTLMSYPEEFIDAVDDADAGVTVDGGDLLNTFRVRDIENAVEE